MRKMNPAMDLIRRFEGLRLRAYVDAGGVWTIGYGHTSMAGPPKVRPGLRITKEQAEDILRRDVQRFARGVAREVGPQAMKRLNDNRFGALVSFAYNVGLGNFRRSSVLRAVKEGRLDDVPRLLMRWTKAGGRRLRGLERRRRAEGRLFMTPPSGATPVAASAPDRNNHAAPHRRQPIPSRDKAAPRAALFVALATIAATITAIVWRNRLMRFIRRLLAPLKGWRTLLFALLVAAVGVAEATDWTSLIPDGPARGWWLLGISLAIAWLRVITTTPVGHHSSA